MPEYRPVCNFLAKFDSNGEKIGDEIRASYFSNCNYQALASTREGITHVVIYSMNELSDDTIKKDLEEKLKQNPEIRVEITSPFEKGMPKYFLPPNLNKKNYPHFPIQNKGRVLSKPL